MRWIVWIVPSLAIAAWLVPAPVAIAQQPRSAPRPPAAKKAAEPAPPPIDPDGSKMEQLLSFWAQRSTKLTSLHVAIDQYNQAGALWGGERTHLVGQAVFRTPNQAWIEFKKVEAAENGQKKEVFYQRIVCTGKEVWDYRGDTKQINVYDLGREARQRALQEGPLPFLFNFRADEAKKRYLMTLLNENDSSFVIRVIPLQTVDKECFLKAYIQLDKTQYLPTEIALIEPDGESKKSYRLKLVSANKDIKDDYFRGQKWPKPWTLHINPVEGARPNPRAAAQPRSPAAARGAPLRQPR